MSAMSGPSIPIDAQIAGVAFARARLAAERALGRIDAALVTLNWLARDWDGALRMLATRVMEPAGLVP